jgi:hypothetical protein
MVPDSFFCSFLLNPNFNLFLVCVEPLAPVEYIIYSKLVSPIICVGHFNHQNHIRKRFDPISLSDGVQFFSIAQLHQRALAYESQFKETSKSVACTIHLVELDSSDDESADVYTVEFVWPTKAKSSASSSLQPVHKNR